MSIKFSRADITEEEIKEVVDTLHSGYITTGTKTKDFEKQLATFCNVKKVACLNSATAGLELILRVLGIGAGDEVITTAYTYTATASVISHVGARIILVDTLKGSYEIDSMGIENAITSRTKVIIAVDIAGKICDYNKIYQAVEAKVDLFVPSNDIQERMGRIAVIADGAHSFGAQKNGILSGSFADFTVFSFHAGKNLTVAEGGAIALNECDFYDTEEMYKQFMIFGLHGQTKDSYSKEKLGAWEYDIVTLGYKCNMTDISASIGKIQLARYPKILERRKEIISIYNDELGDLIEVIDLCNNKELSSGTLYMTRIPNKTELERNNIILALAEEGIPTNVHFKPLPMFTAYKRLGFDIKDFPNAYNQYANEITLPLHTLLTNEDVYKIIKAFKICIS